MSLFLGSNWNYKVFRESNVICIRSSRYQRQWTIEYWNCVSLHLYHYPESLEPIIILDINSFFLMDNFSCFVYKNNFYIHKWNAKYILLILSLMIKKLKKEIFSETVGLKIILQGLCPRAISSHSIHAIWSTHATLRSQITVIN